jgi:hypothetical protein
MGFLRLECKTASKQFTHDWRDSAPSNQRYLLLRYEFNLAGGIVPVQDTEYAAGI